MPIGFADRHVGQNLACSCHRCSIGRQPQGIKVAKMLSVEIGLPSEKAVFGMFFNPLFVLAMPFALHNYLGRKFSKNESGQPGGIADRLTFRNDVVASSRSASKRALFDMGIKILLLGSRCLAWHCYLSRKFS
jgi:hypothetical protein